jgi:hypothetical protein
MMHRTSLGVALGALSVLLPLGGRAWAHPPGGAPLPAAWPAAVVATALAVAIAVLSVAARRRGRAALVVAVVLLAFTFAAGVHSVHHLGEPGMSAGCAIAGACMHLAGVDVAAPAPDRLAPVAAWSAGDRRERAVSIRARLSLEDRAPPVAG